MAGCCGHDKKFDGMSAAYKRILWWIIAINGVMFVVEMLAGVSAHSQSLQADALDFLADSLTYGASLWVIGKSISLRSNVAMAKGISLVMMSLWVLGSTLFQFFILTTPDAFTMGTVAIAAFTANLVSVLLLVRYKDGDANVRSVWLCSRNDAIGNLIVLLAASGVWFTNSAWADLIVALIMAGLFFSSAWQILKQARHEKYTNAQEKRAS